MMGGPLSPGAEDEGPVCGRDGHVGARGFVEDAEVFTSTPIAVVGEEKLQRLSSRHLAEFRDGVDLNFIEAARRSEAIGVAGRRTPMLHLKDFKRPEMME